MALFLRPAASSARTGAANTATTTHDNRGAIFKAFLIPGSFLFLNEPKLWLDFGGLSILRRPARSAASLPFRACWSCCSVADFTTPELSKSTGDPRQCARHGNAIDKPGGKIMRRSVILLAVTAASMASGAFRDD